MTANEADVDRFQFIDHFDDETILVAADVELDPVVSEKAGAPKPVLDVLWITPGGRLCQSVPDPEGLFGITMARLPDLNLGVLGDDAHGAMRLLP